MKILKRLCYTLLALLALIVLTPLVMIQFGSAGMATTSKVVLNMVLGYGGEAPDASDIQQQLEVAEGFSVSLYASDLGKIRFLHVTDAGDLLVSRPRSGDIVLLERDRNGDGLPDAQRVLLSSLTRPHGLDIAAGWLYIAESNGVGKIAFDSAQGQTNGSYQRIVDDLDDKGNHWTKTLRVGDDGWLYLSGGSSCNVCEEEDPTRATIMRFRMDGSEFGVYATGLRNSVGLDWAPWNNALYATDNGRDLLGDNFPPCELNRIEKGGFYGWPYVNASTPDPDFGGKNAAATAKNIPPSHEFRAHNAPLGLRFLRYSKVGGFERTALVALHGSWNRSEPDGYKVVSLHWQGDGTIVEQDFLSGFLQGDRLIGRPVDIAEANDGSLYISDDYSGSIYRVVAGKTAVSSRRLELPQQPQGSSKSDPMLGAYSPEQRDHLRRRGEQLFNDYNCSSCHRGAALSGLAERYELNELASFFSAPIPPMPAFPLSAEDREALAVYLLLRPNTD
ncbi:MAG: PQQ-dependent sugar dehydrogenase [Zhongshania sp.]|uniref:PQQ-dependent sugar dehydrogenase n=1 Tax=Zhongshania sp. TaxID=1971902 RepID=UPI00262EEC7F|nr:PQQ-dependent sugar dehydrogenase [Zhongshania sp.]MDF1693133.1 PQQ-dependent sugar dehydrogenase [Zhongshania sp.]